MAPPSLDLKDARFTSFSNAFSTAASPLRNSFSLSCRSPITPSSSSKPATSQSRYGPSLATPPTQYASNLDQARLPRPSWKESSYIYDNGSDNGNDSYDADDDNNDDDDDDDATTSGSPTDETWFLPRSPGLPPPPILSVDDGKLGVLSAISIIVGKTMGVGAYSVPSAILSGVGSVGMTLVLWVVGALISFCGLAVYLDLGTAMPRSGGERVYLERIFRRPYNMLASCMFMSYVVLLGFSTPNAIVLGEHALYAAGVAENRWNVRLLAVLAVSLFCYVHARYPRWGLRLINCLGIAKIVILVVVVASGIAGGLMGVGNNNSNNNNNNNGHESTSTAQRNFHGIWEGTSTQPYDYATALLKVLYCFRGYSTANQVLGDVRNPVRTLQVAAPVALGLVSIAYLAINIAFFLVVDKDEFRTAGVVVAGVFFRKVFGDGFGAHILPLFVVISAAGNIAATSFAQARVNEELAREGVLPRFMLSKKAPEQPSSPSSSSSPHGRQSNPSSPSKSRPGRNISSPSPSSQPPSCGLLLHWVVSVAAIIFPPPGKIFNFLVDIGGYPVSVISVVVSLGLLYLHLHPDERWVTPYEAPRAAILVFAASNCLLLVLPWVPPRGGLAEDGRFPSFAYPATSLGILGLGAVYWLWWRTSGLADDMKNKNKQYNKSGYRGIGGNAATAIGGGGGDSNNCCAQPLITKEEVTDLEEDKVVAEEDSQKRRKSAEAVAVVHAGRETACGCRSCPQVRRRAVCGCSDCPTRQPPSHRGVGVAEPRACCSGA